MKRKILYPLSLAFTAAVFLTGCSGTPAPTPATTSAETSASSSMTASPSSSSTSSTSSSDVTLKTMETSLGEIIVAGNGMTVYYFTKDTKDSGISACVDNCLKQWPPVLVEDEPKFEGITAKIGTIDAADGKKQVTVDGMPVYYWYKDTKAGDVSGQDVGKVWYVVAPDGKMITTAPTSTSSPSSTASATSPVE